MCDVQKVQINLRIARRCERVVEPEAAKVERAVRAFPAARHESRMPVNERHEIITFEDSLRARHVSSP